MPTTEPSYLPLLNAIVDGERRSSQLLRQWSAVTVDEALAQDLLTVALREAEHAASFEKRINELGGTSTHGDDADHSALMRLVESNTGDLDKFEQLNLGQPEPRGEDQLLGLLADKTIDPITAGMLGRFIAEERDSASILERAYIRSGGNPDRS